MKLTKITLLLLLLIHSNSTFSVTQQQFIGIIISTQGQITATNKSGQTRSLQRHSEIYLNDKITTHEDSKAQLKLQDDSIIVLQPSTEFYVSNFSFNKWSPRNTQYTGNIIKGALINISGQGQASNYQLRSPLTTIAFRGTGLATKINSTNNRPFDQEVYVFQGYVTVSNKCENAVEGTCEPSQIDIGVGQNANSAIINFRGKIQPTESSNLLQGAGEATKSKLLIRSNAGGGSGGNIMIKCKT